MFKLDYDFVCSGPASTKNFEATKTPDTDLNGSDEKKSVTLTWDVDSNVDVVNNYTYQISSNVSKIYHFKPFKTI